MKLADFGLAIEVQGDQQAWFGKKNHLLNVICSISNDVLLMFMWHHKFEVYI